MKETLSVMELVESLERLADTQGQDWKEMINSTSVIYSRVHTTQGKEIGIRMAIQEIFKLAKS